MSEKLIRKRLSDFGWENCLTKIRINDGYDIPLDEPEHFIKVGHAEWPKIQKSYGNF